MAIILFQNEDAVDGLHAKYIVKAVKNLNERVTKLENGKEEMMAEITKCNR